MAQSCILNSEGELMSVSWPRTCYLRNFPSPSRTKKFLQNSWTCLNSTAVGDSRALRSKIFSVQPLCALCLCGSLLLRKNNHRDTEHTEVAQRRSRIETFRAKPVQPLGCP